jgi:hypothetical protein
MDGLTLRVEDLRLEHDVDHDACHGLLRLLEGRDVRPVYRARFSKNDAFTPPGQGSPRLTTHDRTVCSLRAREGVLLAAWGGAQRAIMIWRRKGG